MGILDIFSSPRKDYFNELCKIARTHRADQLVYLEDYIDFLKPYKLKNILDRNLHTLIVDKVCNNHGANADRKTLELMSQEAIILLPKYDLEE